MKLKDLIIEGKEAVNEDLSGYMPQLKKDVDELQRTVDTAVKNGNMRGVGEALQKVNKTFEKQNRFSKSKYGIY